MLPDSIKNKLQRLWNVFRDNGMTNAVTIMEQITYLLYARWLEKANEYDNVIGKRRKSIFDGHEGCQWSNLSQLEPDKMLERYDGEVFPFIKSTGTEYTLFGRYMKAC